MGKRNEGLLDLLTELPWWVSVIVSAVVYIGLKYIVPAIVTENILLKGIAGIAPKLAPFFAFILLIPAPISALNSWRKRKLLDKQKSFDSIRALSWKEFEEFIAEAYRRQGYSVLENTGGGPDGGVDLVLKKDGNVYLVQCKQWRSQKVGVSVVREMYGVMTAERSTGVIIITSGLFTQEAKNFSSDKPIDLVEGNQLLALIGNTPKSSSNIFAENRGVPTSTKLCPKCGGEFVLRVAKRGKSAGEKFWGCLNFPKCRATQPYMG